MNRPIPNSEQAVAGMTAPLRRVDAGDRTSISDLLRLMGAEGDAGADSDRYPVSSRQVQAGSALFHEGGVAEAIYFVSMGSFKIFRTAEDGYEQVLGFVGRGEVLGFDAVWMGRHPMAAAALEPSRVYAMPSKNIFTLGQYVPALDRVLHLAVSRELTRRGEIADLMAAVSAEVRLARFLVHLSERMQASGQSPKHLLLSMCRRDIASHLGVAHETVSRSFSALADWNCLRVSNREVEILDMARLKALSRSTRGSTDDMPGRTQTNHRNARG